MSEWCVAVHAGAALGEGLFWDTARGRLWFVDILAQRVHAWTPGEAGWRSWHAPQRVGWVMPLPGDEDVLLGLQEGVAVTRLEGAPRLRWVCRLFESGAPTRLNDAKADPTGAVWAGTLNHDDESRDDGALYRIDLVTGTARRVDDGYKVANGPAISADGRRMLHTDSGRRTIYTFDLDPAAGEVRDRRVWKRLEGAEGYPDGMTFDAEGCLWVAHWAGSCISRFSPEGDLLRRVMLPAAHITNVCFGGPGLDRLFVTSARAGLDAAQVAAQPLAGAVFEVDARGVRGLPPCLPRL